MAILDQGTNIHGIPGNHLMLTKKKLWSVIGAGYGVVLG